jgi:hypothetical protein
MQPEVLDQPVVGGVVDDDHLVLEARAGRRQRVETGRQGDPVAIAHEHEGKVHG